ncbi:site-specific recombinase [Alsobacter soli]|uniref:Site-specific recombinase n=1 Tax=Alsobacter soli TaxID=2109933 RepID=A0A2T1HMG1_9HYPH|nr:recombinase family protein [Alsobacter soli]PSC02845.1 site-specific recombinase [Alsobacter soli]
MSTTARRPRAYSYLRMSTDIQLRGDSRRRQLELSTRYAEEHNLDLMDGRMEDIGISAFKGANLRKGVLGEFLTAVREGKIEKGSYLLVESLDRLSRQDVFASLTLFIEILNAGIIIVTLVDKHEYHAGAELTMIMYSIMVMSRSNEESSLKSTRLSSAWSNKRKNISSRKLTGQCPAWLRLNAAGKFDILGDRVDVIRRIFDDSAAGIGSYTIANRLNEGGVPPFRSDAGWQISSVNKILNNRAVLGEFQPHRFVEGERVPEGPPIADYFPRIVDDELFYRVKSARESRRLGGGGRRGAHISNLFSGLARCGYCGGKLHFVNKGQGPKGGTYLMCDKARRGLGCERTAWRYEDFEAAVLQYVHRLDLAQLASGADERSHRAQLDARISSLQGQILEAQQRRDRAFNLYLDSASDHAKSGYERADRRVSELDQELSTAAASRDKLDGEESRFYESREQIQSLIGRLGKRDDEETYKLRAQLAARMKGLMAALDVYAAGKEPLDRATLRDASALAEAQSEPMRSALALISKDLASESARRRYLTIVFKDGTLQVLYPDDTTGVKNIKLEKGIWHTIDAGGTSDVDRPIAWANADGASAGSLSDAPSIDSKT